MHGSVLGILWTPKSAKKLVAKLVLPAKIPRNSSIFVA